MMRCTVMPATLIAVLSMSSPVAGAEPAIIPSPVEMRVGEGEFGLSDRTVVVAQGGAAAEAQKLIDALAPAMGYRLTLHESVDAQRDVIHLRIETGLKTRLGDEGYTLTVAPQGIELAAATPAGLFYAIQTLRQLLPVDVYRAAAVADVDWTVPCVEVIDYPRFPWRGLLVDPARHFIPKRDMMRYIDAMALHKFNRLQIHLTDADGWRIEIERYPLLTEIGSRWHRTADQGGDKGRIYGGYYTQNDIRELVRYAAERHVTLVAEIEMPYHTGAAIVAYPKLGFDPEKLAALAPMERRPAAGSLVVPRPYTVQFFQDVLDEVVGLFPSEYIHIGGDEADAEAWAGLPEMQELMKAEGLADIHELHGWFIRQMDAHLTRRGRKLVGWDEILQGGLAEGATVMSWRGTQGGISAAKAGHDVVMTPTSHTYFDYRQGPDLETEVPGLGSNVIDLAKVFTFEAIPAQLDAEEAKHVLGGQAQVWGELIPSEQHREYQTYPRACALIERIWSPPDHDDYGQFLGRLEHHTGRLDAAGIHYRPLD